MVTLLARVWINRVRLLIMHVISWTGKIDICVSAFAPENLVSRDGLGSPVPRQPPHLHTYAKSGAYLRDSSRVPRRRPFIYYMVTHTYSKSMDQPGKVSNPARGQLNRAMNVSLSAFAPENLVSRDGFGSPLPRQPAHLHTQAESGAYLRDSSRVPRRRPLIYFKPPYAIGWVPSLSGHAPAYRWRSLPSAHGQ